MGGTSRGRVPSDSSRATNTLESGGWRPRTSDSPWVVPPEEGDRPTARELRTRSKAAAGVRGQATARGWYLPRKVTIRELESYGEARELQARSKAATGVRGQATARGCCPKTGRAPPEEDTENAWRAPHVQRWANGRGNAAGRGNQVDHPIARSPPAIRRHVQNPTWLRMCFRRHHAASENVHEACAVVGVGHRT